MMNIDQKIGNTVSPSEKPPKPSILENPELQSFLESHKEIMDEHDAVDAEESKAANLGSKFGSLTEEQIQKAEGFIKMEEERFRPFRIALYQTIASIPNLSDYAAKENYDAKESEFRQKHGKTHNFILATARYLDRSRLLEAKQVDWDDYVRPAGFLPDKDERVVQGTNRGKKIGDAPNLLMEIQLRTCIKSPLIKRPDLNAVKEMNLPKYEKNPLNKYFLDQIFKAFDEAGLPYDAFEFQNNLQVTKEDVMQYLKIIGKILEHGYQSKFVGVMFSS